MRASFKGMVLYGVLRLASISYMLLRSGEFGVGQEAAEVYSTLQLRHIAQQIEVVSGLAGWLLPLAAGLVLLSSQWWHKSFVLGIFFCTFLVLLTTGKRSSILAFALTAPVLLLYRVPGKARIVMAAAALTLMTVVYATVINPDFAARFSIFQSVDAPNSPLRRSM